MKIRTFLFVTLLAVSLTVWCLVYAPLIVQFIALLFLYCLVFARLEAETEGAHGWAAKLPTAHYHLVQKKEKEGRDMLYFFSFGTELERAVLDENTGKYRIVPAKGVAVDDKTLEYEFFRFYIKYFLGGLDFTWYHRVVDLIQFFVAHLMIYLCFKSDSVSIPTLEVRAIATLMLIWSIEDTLWFYVNPSAKESDHHKEWIMIGSFRFMAKGMFVNFVGGLILLPLSFFFASIWQVVVNIFRYLI